MNGSSRWLHSLPFDLTLIIGPPLISGIVALLWRPASADDIPLWAWLVFIVAIDVAHVYSSLYRVYFDRAEFTRRRGLYVNVPLVCLAAGVLLYSHSALAFWRALAYVAVFHFVRQQWGFLRIYQHLGGGRSPWDDRLDAVAIYSTMLYPLAFWHGNGERTFVWFTAGDFLRLPALPAVAGWIYGAVLTAFVLRQAQVGRAGHGVNWGKIGVVLSTAAAWYIGIVFLNSDLAFTVTNVVAHGVPYLALVWLYGRRKWPGTESWLEPLHRPAFALLFLLPLVGMAYAEEGLWDLFVWHEHGAAFGSLPALDPGPWLRLLVPLLALPQATHYVLDAWIWRFDGSNPGLRDYLFGTPVTHLGHPEGAQVPQATTP